MLRCAKELKLKARAVKETLDRPGHARSAALAIVQLSETMAASSSSAGSTENDDLLIQDPPWSSGRSAIKRAEFRGEVERAVSF
jgi:hypothetical protein